MDLRDPGGLKTRDIVRVLALIFGFYVLLRLLWIAHPVVFLFFLGVLFGLPLAQGADWLEKRRVPRSLGVTIILAAFLGLLTGAGVWMSPILRTQSRELQVRLPEALDKIDAWLGHRANGVLGMLFNEESSADSARIAAAQRVDSTAAAAPAAVVVDSTRIDSAAAILPGGVVRTTTRTHEVEVGGNLRREITRQFRGAQHSFLRVLTSTFAVSGALMLVLFIAAYIGVVGYFIIQFVENHLLVPVLMKAGVNLPPALTLGIQALMSLLFGFLGLLVAVPLLAAILTIVRTMNATEMREISAEADAAVSSVTARQQVADRRRARS